MKHIHEDTLVKYALGILKADEKDDVRIHIERCGNCRDKYKKIEGDIRFLSSIKPILKTPVIPLPTAKSELSNILKIAAILMIGFVTGFGASILSRPATVNVIPYYKQPAVSQSSASEFIQCQPDVVQFEK
ncbi:hypothetical protein K9N50_07955 [bacterium]|nr:hypothetical protein [bacterium]